jgi:hypothetical protein
MAHARNARASHPAVGGIGKWAAALAFVLVLGMTLVSLQLFQLTARSTSEPALRRALNALVEGDAIIERNYDDLRVRAEASQPGEALLLRDYPVAVPLTREEALASSKDGLRRTLLDRAGERMYDGGTSVLRGDGGSGSAGRFTASGAVDEFLGFLRERVHGILAVLTLVLMAVSALLAIVLAAFCRGFGRLAGIGAAVLAASAPLLLGGLAMRLYAKTSAGADGEYLHGELMEIAASLAWLPVRNGIAFTLMGAAMLATGVVCARRADSRRRDAAG